MQVSIGITIAPYFFDTITIIMNPFSADGGFAIEGLGGSEREDGSGSAR
jgi:hypothetical protein